MPFITKPDFDDVLPSQTRLDLITDSGSGPVDAIWQSAVGTAIERIRSGTNARFDMDAMYAATGTNRNALLLRYTLQLAVYYVYQRVLPDKIPASVLEHYDAVIEWLNGVKKLNENPNWPTRTDVNQDYVRYGSDPKRNNNVL